MSLINQMLQDLEARRARLSGDAGMPNEVRSLPPQTVSKTRPVLLLGMLIVLIAGLGSIWWMVERGPQTAAVQPVATAQPSPPPSAAIPPTPPPPQVAAQTDAALQPSVVPGQGMEASPGPVTEKAEPPPVPSPLKAEPVLDKQPKEKREAPAPVKVAESRDTPLRPATSIGQLPPAEAASQHESRIEKKIRPTTQRERAENEYRRALGLVNQGRIQEAQAVLRAALNEDAGHAGSRLALFGLLVEQQRYDEAQAVLAEVLAHDPAQPQLAARLARLQLERGDARAARQTLDKAAGAAQDNAEFRAFHAAVLQRLTLHKEAVAEYQAALKLAPQAGVWWMGLGLSLEAEGRSAEAREAFQKARASGTLSAEVDRFVEQKLRQLQ